jgi:hypothetical protein
MLLPSYRFERYRVIEAVHFYPRHDANNRAPLPAVVVVNLRPQLLADGIGPAKKRSTIDPGMPIPS